MKVRTLIFVAVAALLIPLMVGGVLVLGVAVQLPSGQDARVKGPHGMVGVFSQSSYAWIIPAGENEVVVVDGGQDPSAKALKGEIGGRKVLAVLLTHGHSDTSAGIDSFPEATLVYGPGEGALLKGETSPKGWLASWLARSAPKVRLPDTVVEATDGQELAFGNVRMRAVHVPGHTEGSVVYLWRDVLFVGDAVLVRPSWMMMPEAFSDAPEQAKESLSALLPLNVEWAADARGGLVQGARAGLVAFLEVEPGEPTVSLTDPVQVDAHPMKVVGELVTVEGVLSQAMVLEASGLRPARLITADGRGFVLSDGPLLAHKDLWNRAVVAKGRPVSSAVLGRGALAGPRLEITEIEAASEGPDLAMPEGWLRGQWVERSGVLSDVAQLAPGSSFADARMDGVALTVPWVEGAAAQQQLVTVVGEVAEAGPEPRLAVRAVCLGRVVGCGTGRVSQEE